ncbi:MAG TPA: ABC transporter substrate-binding protein [bacterium]|nr:ABC transporter substrate-binding protein [bacterium]
MTSSAWRVILGACLVALPMIGLGVAGSHAAPPASIIFGLSSEPPNLDPALQSGTAAQTVKIQLYRGLFAYNAEGAVEKDLVGSYEQPAPTSYVFSLRPNSKFSDGSPLTSADVVFTFERIADPRVGAYLAKRMSAVESVTAVDLHTVKITLNAPDATFLQMLAAPTAAVVSKRFTLAHGNDLKTAALGAGPYRLTQWQRGIQLTVARNPYYYRQGRPKTPAIKFAFYPDENSRVAALESGTVDLIEYVPWQDIATILANPQFGYQGTNGPFMFLIFNLAQPPFNDVRVREAVGFAVNRAAIIRTAFFGRGSPIYSLPIPAASFAYDQGLAHYYTYDPAKAKRLLAEAGFGNGFTATLLSTAQYGMHKDTAEVVQQDLNALGNHITLSLPDWPTRVSLGSEGRYQFAVHGTAGDLNDPDFLSAYFHSGPLNYLVAPGYANPTLDQLLDQARATLDVSKRKALYNRIQKAALDDSAYIFLTWREQGYAYKKSLSGFRNLPGFLTFYSGYTLEETAPGK